MPHPSLDEILRGTTNVSEHLATCETCRALAALARGPADTGAPFPAEVVDRDRYVEWRALGAGGGGMGRTFQARDKRLGREVVIKQPLASDQGIDLNARFEREALLTARLQHPAIVSVYEAGRFPDGEPFYAMPLVRGAPLSEEIAHRPTLERRLALLQNVTTACEAIAYAHEQGIVHRDVKPANILVGSFGETVVIDWGLAVDVRSDAGAPSIATVDVADGLTQLGIGTPHYMSPEQALGGKPDPRMDVYALGATLYHALAGQPPFANADSGQARRLLLEEAPQPLADVAPDVPPPLCDIVMRAMSRDPAKRFDTANALAAELRRFQTGQLVQSRRYTPAEILRHFARRYRAPLIVAGIAAVVLAAGAVASTVRITRARSAASAAQQRAEQNERSSQQALRRSLGVSASRLALSPTRRLDALALAVDAVAPDLAAGNEPAHDALQGLYDANGAGALAIALDAITTEVQRFAFSADGSLLATVSPGDHAVHLWDGRTGKSLGAAVTGGAHFSVRDVRFSPDNAWLMTWGDEPAQAQLWPIRTGRAITLPLDGSIAGAEFLPDGTIVVAGNGVAFLRDDGAEVRRVALPAAATSLAVNAGKVAVGTTAGDVVVLDVSGRTLASFRAPSVTALALSRDGSRVAVLGTGALEIVDVATGPSPVASSQPRVPLVVSLAASADRHAELAFAGSDRYVVVADRAHGSFVVDTKTSRATSLDTSRLATSQIGELDHLAASWTGVPGRLSRFDLEALASVQTIDGPPGLALATLAVSSDGRIAAATERASWIVDGRAEAAGFLPGHTSEVSALVRTDTSIVSAGLDGKLVAWDAEGRAIDSTSVGSEVLAMAAAYSMIVVGAADGTVTAYAMSSGRFDARAILAPAGAPISAVAFSADPRHVLVARNDGELFAVGLAGDYTPVRWQAAGSSPVTTIAVSADNVSFATGHLDGTVRRWRVRPGMAARSATIVGEVKLPEPGNPGRARFTLDFTAQGNVVVGRFGEDTLVYSPDLSTHATLEGRLVAANNLGIATVAPGGDLLLFRNTRNLSRPPLRFPMSGRPIVTVTSMPDRMKLLAGDIDGRIRVVDASGADDSVLEIASSSTAVTSLATIGTTVFAGHASGELRTHAITPDAALDRACRTLAHFGRESAGCASAK